MGTSNAVPSSCPSIANGFAKDLGCVVLESVQTQLAAWLKNVIHRSVRARHGRILVVPTSESMLDYGRRQPGMQGPTFIIRCAAWGSNQCQGSGVRSQEAEAQRGAL